MLPDLRFAVRSLAKTRAFTLVAVVTMAVAIGACTSLFSVIQAVVLRPLPYPDLDSLVTIWSVNRDRDFQAPAVSWDKYVAYRERKDLFRAFAIAAGNGFTLTEGTGEPEQVFGQQVSANFLPVLGLAPLRGRNFLPEEDRAGGAPVAMISRRLWQNRFAGDPAIIGRVLQIDGVAREVIAILPEPMPAPYNGTDILVTQARELPYLREDQRDYAIFHQAYARLAPGVTLEQARARLAEMSQLFASNHPGHMDSANTNEPRTLAEQVLGNLDRTFWTLAGAVGAVLLIACANIANLFLARVSARQKEIAVRLSLGARPAEIIRQFVTESLVFTVLAGGLGTLLAWWSLRGIELLAANQLPRADEIALNPLVLLFALGASLLAGLLIGIYPALQAARTDVQGVLKDNTRGAGGGAAAKAFRHVLVVGQVGLSLTLLVCAGLLVLSFHRLQTAPAGFATAGRAFGQVNLPAARYNTPELIREFQRQLQDRLRAAPELAHAALTANLPLGGQGYISPYTVKGRPIRPVNERPLATIADVSVDYFTALGIPLRGGRAFSDADNAATERVVIISESFARKLFPGEDPLAQSFLLGGRSDINARIVGIVADVKTNGLNAPPPDQLYFPVAQRGAVFFSIVGEARPGLAAAAVVPVLRRVLFELDPGVALANPQSLDELVSQSVAVQRLTMTLLLCFAGIAALLAAVGVYSVMAYSVTQRIGEIGVRMALGATAHDVLRLVFRAGATQVTIGLVLGLGGSFAATRLLQEALFDVKPFEPSVFAVVCGGFALVALLACLIPARRAMRVDPMVALRSE